MSELVVATVMTPDRAPWARLLADGLAAHHPGLRLVAGVAGDPPPPDPAYAALPGGALGLPEALAVGGDALAACCALKPLLIRHLLDAGHPAVLYLDVDQLPLAPLPDLLDRVRRHALVLSPHVTAPLDAERELLVLRSGTYNGGLVGCSDTPETRRFLAFWADRCARHPVRAPEQGLNYDQRWLDLAPGHVEDLHVLRDPTLNVGHWGLPERVDPLPRLLHLSGFDPDEPGRLSRHSALTAADLGPLGPVLHAYAARLRALSAPAAAR